MRQKYLLKLCTVVMTFLIPLGFMAQTIKGKITDSSGGTLPYMNVVEKGTKNGTVTDDNGEFSITVKSVPTTITISSMGFATKSVKVTNSDYLTIVVQEDNALNEIVLVGSRGKPRTAFDSPVPIDNIKISELTQRFISE
jgi:iron complex outermembrane receptor protein